MGRALATEEKSVVAVISRCFSDIMMTLTLLRGGTAKGSLRRRREGQSGGGRADQQGRMAAANHNGRKIGEMEEHLRAAAESRKTQKEVLGKILQEMMNELNNAMRSFKEEVAVMMANSDLKIQVQEHEIANSDLKIQVQEQEIAQLCQLLEQQRMQQQRFEEHQRMQQQRFEAELRSAMIPQQQLASQQQFPFF